MKLVPHIELVNFSSLSYSISTFCVGEVEVLVAPYKEYTVVAIRGTETGGLLSEGGWRDVLRDARAIPYNSEVLGWGHKGFLRASELVLEKLSHYLCGRERLVFTGHSLGGAIALACSYGAWRMNWDVRQMVGFGTPKVFYRESKKLPLEDVAYTLYENGTDPVPRVPIVFGKRIVKPMQIGKKKGIKSLIPSFKDHSLSSYERNMAN